MTTKKIVSVLAIALLTISMFSVLAPSGFAANYTLIVDAATEDTICQFDQSVTLTPAEQDLQDIIVGVYLQEFCQPGGAKQDTKAHYTDLSEGIPFDIKVPMSAYKLTDYYAPSGVDPNLYEVYFEHWEVWDQDGDPELQWLYGDQYKQIYTGSWVKQDVTYTRITKILPYPKYMKPALRPEIEDNLEMIYQRTPKELLDRSDGVLEPYLRFTITNPVGGGDKLLYAVYHIEWAGKSEHLYFKTIYGAEAEVLAFKNGETDMLTDLIRFGDVEDLADDGVITSAPGYHLCYVASNLRLAWMGPQDGTEPGNVLRKAIAQLYPKDTLIALLFKYIVKRLDTMVPHALGEWYYVEPDMIYDYDPVEAYNTLVDGGFYYDDAIGTWRRPDDIAVGGDDYSIEILSPLAEVAVTSFTIVATLCDEMNALSDPATGDPTPLAATHAPTDFWTIVERAFYTHTYEMYFLCWGALDSPDYLYYVMHSMWDIPWGDNAPGIHNDTLDSYLEIIFSGLDHDEKVDAAYEAQKIMMDTLCYIPTYSRNYFNAHQNEIYGIVNSPGYSIDNFWTYVNIKGWRDSALFVPPLTQIPGTETIIDLGEHVESFNPAQAGSAYAAQVMGIIHDGLLALNPFTNEYKPWLAESWESVGPITMTTPTQAAGCVVGEQSVVDGMYAEFTLIPEIAEGKVVWHDGEVFNADDIVWDWNFIWTELLTNHLNFYADLVDIQKVDADTVRCYWNTTSQWLLYAAAGNAALYPEQIYGKLVGQGDILIREFNPETHLRSEEGAYPAQAAYPWLTQVVGIGPYVLYSTDENGENINLFTFDLKSHTAVIPWLHFHRTQAAIFEQKIEDFYHIGDVNIDASVDITDLASIGIKYGQKQVPYVPPPGTSYLGFTQEDVVHDGVINIKDLATAGKNYGKEKEY